MGGRLGRRLARPDDTIARALSGRDTLQPAPYRSRYHDLVHGRRLEVETLYGHAVRLGTRRGIATPTLFAVHAARRPAWLAAEAAR